MKNSDIGSQPNRRDAVKMLALGSTAGFFGVLGMPFTAAAEESKVRSYQYGLPPVKIKNVKAIATAPEGINLVVVKVETSEPGLYGLGCATFTQRAAAVVAAINSYMNEF